jgi:para-aminobenzoate synthetase component 1
MRRMMAPVTRPALAHLGGAWAHGLLEVADDISALERGGRWAVAIPYSGAPVLARFEHWSDRPPVDVLGGWRGPAPDAWVTSSDERDYVAMVGAVRSAIEAGDVYQANICRVLAAPMSGPADDVAALWMLLAEGNPAPHGGFLRLPASGVSIASASPELFLRLDTTEEGRILTSGPIKGTGRTAADLSDKDVAENIMIVDLVRNDLARVCVPGTVTVPHLLQVQEHPGLVHLVSYVEGRMRTDATWADTVEATFPPGSVTGAPKIAALAIIDALEPEPREYYCGAFGWIDADRGVAELAVAIRTFWLRDGVLRFGTGAGITWGSDAQSEWRETELKAARLIGLAGGSWQADGP